MFYVAVKDFGYIKLNDDLTEATLHATWYQKNSKSNKAQESVKSNNEEQITMDDECLQYFFFLVLFVFGVF